MLRFARVTLALLFLALSPVFSSPHSVSAQDTALRTGRAVQGALTTGDTLGYSFEDRGHVYRYAVDVPRDYDSRTPAPLLIDPGHGSGKDQDAEGKAGFVEYFRGAANAAGGAEDDIPF